MVWACDGKRGNESRKSGYENERRREKRKTKEEMVGYN